MSERIPVVISLVPFVDSRPGLLFSFPSFKSFATVLSRPIIERTNNSIQYDNLKDKPLVEKFRKSVRIAPYFFISIDQLTT